jgi:hypothetical protein
VFCAPHAKLGSAVMLNRVWLDAADLRYNADLQRAARTRASRRGDPLGLRLHEDCSVVGCARAGRQGTSRDNRYAGELVTTYVHNPATRIQLLSVVQSLH